MPYAPSFGIQIFHGVRGNGKMYVEMYSHHGGYGTQPVFGLDEAEDPNWFNFFKEQFEEIWLNSIVWLPQLSEVGKQNNAPMLSNAKAADFLFENNPDLTPYFQEAIDIRLYGIDMSGTVRNHLDSLTKSLEHENSSLKVIITSEKIYTAHQKDSIEALKWLATNPKNKGKVEVREYEGNTHFAFFATDPLLPKGRIQIKMYTQFWKQYKHPKFELFKNRDPHWVDYFMTQFDMLWENSVPVLSNDGFPKPDED